MPNPFAQRLVRNIRRLVSARRWSLEQAALETGLSRSHFFYILSGQRAPSMTALKKICDALEVDVSELWRP